MGRLLKECLLIGSGGVISLVGAGGKTSLMFRLAKEALDSGDSVLSTTTTRIMQPTSSQSSHVILADSTRAVLDSAGNLTGEPIHVTVASRRTPDGGKLIGLAPHVIDELYHSGRFKWILVEADGAARKKLKAPADHEPVIPATTDRVVGLMGLSAIGKPLIDEWVFRAEIYAKITGLGRNATITPESVAASILHPNGILKGAPPGARRTIFLNLAEDLSELPKGRELAALLTHSKSDTDIDSVIIGNALGKPAIVAHYGSRWTEVA